jgi:hypothetical protein
MGEKWEIFRVCPTFNIFYLFFCGLVSVGIVGENGIKKATPKSGDF